MICGQGPAPQGDDGREDAVARAAIVPGTGFLCAPIPGAFDAWALMLRDHGTWTLRDVLEYAIGYAARGAHVVPRVSATWRRCGRCSRALAEQRRAVAARGRAEAGRLYTIPNSPRPTAAWCGRPRPPAATATAQIEAARNIWYGGFVAEAIDNSAAASPALDTSGRQPPRC